MHFTHLAARWLWLSLAIPVFSQSIPQPISVTNIYNITSGLQVIDNRSITQSCNNFVYEVLSGTGGWSITIQYSDAASSGPWTNFASATATVTSAATIPVGFGYGYHPWVRLNTTAGTTNSHLACERGFPLPVASNVMVFPAANQIGVSNGSANGWLSSPTSSVITSLWTDATCATLPYLRKDNTCGSGGNFGTVSSVGVTVPSFLTVSPSAITSSGTFAIQAKTGLAAYQILGTDTSGNVGVYAFSSNYLPASGVTAGSYTCSSLTVDATGRVTAASSGTCSGFTAVAIQQNGTPQGSATTLNCTTNMTCSVSGSVATISSTGGGGGGTITSIQVNGATLPITSGVVDIQAPNAIDGQGTNFVQTGSGDASTGQFNLRNLAQDIAGTAGAKITTSGGITGSACGNTLWVTAGSTITLTLSQPNAGGAYNGCWFRVNTEQASAVITIAPPGSGGTIINANGTGGATGDIVMNQTAGTRKAWIHIMDAALIGGGHTDVWEFSFDAN